MKKEMKNIPELRYPEFEGIYNTLAVRELFTRISDSVDVTPDGTYREIGIRSHGKGIFHKEVVKGKTLGNKRVFWIKPDVFILNIVFAWEHAIAKTTANEVGMIASHRFPMYQPKDGITCLDYALYFFLTKRGKHLLGLASPGGAGRNKTLGQKAFEELKVLWPPLPEQQKIASFLTAVDKKIEQLTRKRDLLEQYKKGVMQKIFSQEIRFKDENGQDYPDWEEKRFQDVVMSKKGAMKIGPFGSQLKKETFLSEGYKVYGQENVFSGDFEFGDRYISFEHFNRLKTNEIQAGDYVISTMGTIGKSCIVPDNIQQGIMDSHIIRFKLDNKIIYPLFLTHLFLTYDLLKQVKRFSVGGIMDGLSMGIIKEIKFQLPSFPEQQKIANFLSSIDNKITTVQTQLTQTQNFKKGLLQKMFV